MLFPKSKKFWERVHKEKGKIRSRRLFWRTMGLVTIQELYKAYGQECPNCGEDLAELRKRNGT